MVDTLRADHLSSYGYPRPTSPALDRFANSAVFFDNAFSQAGCTFPSVNSMLTSRYPHRFLFQPRRDWSIPEETPSMAEILASHGYSTFAVSASSVVRKTPTVHNKVGGYDRGFAIFDEHCLDGDADCVNDTAMAILNELDGADRPFFGYLHYVDPHQPYQPPEEFARSFSSDSTGDGQAVKPFIRRGEIAPIEEMIYHQGPDLALKSHDIQHLIALYDDEIAYFDQQLAALLDELDRRGLSERTLMVIASDHGEAFLEHGDIHHCRDLVHSTVLHTPLMLRIPGLDAVRSAELAQNLDILPTVLDYLAIDEREFEFDGKSLRRSIEDRGRVNRHAFSSQGVMRTVVDNRYRLTLNLESGAVQLFDHREDPMEAFDLASQHPQTVQALRSTLRDWIVRYEGKDSSQRSVRRAREVREQLRALGYL